MADSEGGTPELRRLAEAVREFEIASGGMPSGCYEDARDDLARFCTPERILALLDAVERAEVWRAHVPCTSEQHDPANGMLHGFCVRCRTPWPCEYSPEAPTNAR